MSGAGHIRKTPAGYLDVLRLVLGTGHSIPRTIAVCLAVSPPVLCALLVRGPERWSLFERSGALTSAIGLLAAARRYIHRGVIEIATMDRDGDSQSNRLELVENVHATKMGFVISAFGMVIGATGKYLHWWTFSFLVAWAAMIAFDAWRDFVRLRDTDVADPLAPEGAGPDTQTSEAGPAVAPGEPIP